MICDVILRKRNKEHCASKFFRKYQKTDICVSCSKELKDFSSSFCKECEKDLQQKTRKRFSRN